jgi:signal transduction histidine kinase/CheY-like chemotaxis protein
MKLLKRYLTYILGDKNTVDSERYFLTLIHATIIFFLIPLFVMHASFHNSLRPILVTIVSIITIVVLYFLVRFKGQLFIPKLVLTVFGLLALDMIWFDEYLSIGPMLYFIFAFGALIVWVWKGRMLQLLIAFYFLNILTLYLIESSGNFHLEQFVNYRSRSVDIYLNFTFYSLLLIFLFQKIKEDFHREKERAIKSDLMKSAFLANMSHEIRTPMNAIVGFSELLNDEDDAEKRAQYIQIIQSSSGNLLKLINEIVDLSKIEAGEMALTRSNFSIKAIFEEMLNVYQVEIKQRKLQDIQLVFDLPDGDFIIYSDPYRLKQILSNLLGNAVKHTSSGKIEFSCKKDGKQLIFAVADSGTGIPDEDQNKIFERFIKFNYLNKNNEGTGIGLSIVEKLVHLLNGTIWVKSKWGEGSTFFFTIPFDKATTTHFPIEKKISTPQISEHFTQKSILIVEDDEINAQLLKEIIKKHFANYEHVTNGEQALTFLKVNPTIDIVLLDMNMPIMNGYEAAKAIKRAFPTITIIAQTANAVLGDREKALEAGCDEYIAKPIDQNQLLALINSITSNN